MKKILLKIDGMRCGMCESHVNNLVLKETGVRKVKSSASKKQTVVIAVDELNEEKLKESIEKDGYRVLEITSEPYEKKGLLSFFKK